MDRQRLWQTDLWADIRPIRWMDTARLRAVFRRLIKPPLGRLQRRKFILVNRSHWQSHPYESCLSTISPAQNPSPPLN